MLSGEKRPEIRISDGNAIVDDGVNPTDVLSSKTPEKKKIPGTLKLPETR